MESKTIRWPSGDHRGLPTNPCREVNCNAFEPSLAHTQTSVCPERPEANTIFLPSGEYCGASSGYVEEIRLTGSPVFSFGPGSSSRQILVSLKDRVYASRSPRCEIAGRQPATDVPKSGCGGSPPATRILHSSFPNVVSPPGPDPTIISRPSAVQAGHLLHLRLKVSCFGSAFGVRSCESSSR